MIEGRVSHVGDGVRVVPIKGVVATGEDEVDQAEMTKSAACMADVKGNIMKHVAFYVADETPQPLLNGLLDEGHDDVMSLSGTCTAHYLHVLVEGRGREAPPSLGSD